MPKNANILPNGRVDIPDFKQATSVLSRGTAELHRKLVYQDRSSVIAEGFLTEIANQGSFPGLFSIHNGIGYDRDGKIINNEDDEDATRSATLVGDATYFIEVEFTETESDSDARAFWDTTYNNGAGVEPGREFSQTVATRITPDWQIVTPISTTAFERTSDPSSAKIPVAVITVAGGLISGGTTSPLRSVVSADASIGATAVTLLNTRAMPQSFTLRLDPGGANQEDVVVSVNDQSNGKLVCTALTANHLKGERTIIIAGADFLVERITSALPTSGTEDGRTRFYQANEERGALIGLDPTGTGEDRSDLQVENLKRYVDFLAGQLRELKFGGQAGSDVGDLAPPNSFVAEPRYFSRAGGILGARSNTVSVGDGVATWGDFNSVQSGSAQAALQAAHDALPADGGTIYIKAGAYSIGATTVTFSKNVHLVGDKGSSVIDAGGAVPAITYTGAGLRLSIEGVDILATGTSLSGLEITNGGKINIQRCLITSMLATGSGVVSGYVCDTEFTFGTTSTLGIDGTYHNIVFERCDMFGAAGAGSRGARFSVTSTEVTLRVCNFDLGADNQYGIEQVGGAETHGPLIVVGCTFTGGDSTSTGLFVGPGCQKVRVVDCTSDCSVGLVHFEPGPDIGVNTRNVHVRHNKISYAAGQVGISFASVAVVDADAIIGIDVSHNEIEETGAPVATAGRGIHADAVQEGVWSNNLLRNCGKGIALIGFELQDGHKIIDNTIVNGGNLGRIGIECNASSSLIRGNTIAGVTDDTDNTCIGIALGSGAFIAEVCSNKVSGVGAFNGPDFAYGIFINGATNAHVTGNTISTVAADASRAVGIWCEGTIQTIQINDNIVVGCTVNSATGTGRSLGIATELPTFGVSINGNTIRDVGNNTCSVQHAGILCAGTSSFSTNIVDISHNTIRALLTPSSANKTGAIVVQECGNNMNICNNRMELEDSQVYGIYLEQNTAGNSALSDVVVTGNIVAPSPFNYTSQSCLTGIDIDVPQNGTSKFGRFVVSNNIITNADTGLSLRGDTTDSRGWAICGNVITSNVDEADGITCYDILMKTINDNVVELSAGTNILVFGIFASGGGRSTVCGNHISIASGSGSGTRFIDLSAETQTMISGNMMFCSGTWVADGAKVAAGSPAHCVGNLIDGATGQSYNGIASEARRDVFGNQFLDPTAFTDIGLNIDG